jgi:hypothetical protein
MHRILHRCVRIQLGYLQWDIQRYDSFCVLPKVSHADISPPPSFNSPTRPQIQSSSLNQFVSDLISDASQPIRLSDLISDASQLIRLSDLISDASQLIRLSDLISDASQTNRPSGPRINYHLSLSWTIRSRFQLLSPFQST